ncbi:MAG: type II toxin-antitoxin system RelE/ParE family toxin [Alphaproteobacteria bacterium]|nr:type II toxin-antitoxin system RelE/ParE family toxin [Alphaproteobacteria bacterium]
MKRLVFAKRAVTDLEAIADYIAADSPARATIFVQELRGACGELCTMPERYPLVEGHQSSGIRRRVYGSYLIFFRVGSHAVEILHILHGAMDYQRILFPES